MGWPSLEGKKDEHAEVVNIERILIDIGPCFPPQWAMKTACYADNHAFASALCFKVFCIFYFSLRLEDNTSGFNWLHFLLYSAATLFISVKIDRL